jgi:hypothetical protein
MTGPGNIHVFSGTDYVGCLDETMKWVAGPSCGVFTANTITSPSSKFVLCQCLYFLFFCILLFSC